MKHQTNLQLIIFLFTFFISCNSQTKPVETWKKAQLGSMGLTVEAPFTFLKKDMNGILTPSMKKVVNKMETYINESPATTSYYSVNMVEYTDGVELSHDGAVEGALNEIKLQTGGDITDRTDVKKNINGNDATLTTIKLKKKDQPDMEMQMVIIFIGRKMYQVVGVYKDSNTDSRQTAIRLMESVQISKAGV